MKLSIFLQKEGELENFIKECEKANAESPYNFYSFVWTKKNQMKWEKLANKYLKLQQELDLPINKGLI